jgi:hypothetical protein
MFSSSRKVAGLGNLIVNEGGNRRMRGADVLLNPIGYYDFETN